MKARFAVPGKVVPAGGLMTPGGEQGLPGAPGGIADLSAVISSDANNTLTEGTDSLLYVPTPSGGGGTFGYLNGTWIGGSTLQFTLPAGVTVQNGLTVLVSAVASTAPDATQAMAQPMPGGTASIIYDEGWVTLDCASFKGFTGARIFQLVWQQTISGWILVSGSTRPLVSSNANNTLARGTDGRLFVPAASGGGSSVCYGTGVWSASSCTVTLDPNSSPWVKRPGSVAFVKATRAAAPTYDNSPAYIRMPDVGVDFLLFKRTQTGTWHNGKDFTGSKLIGVVWNAAGDNSYTVFNSLTEPEAAGGVGDVLIFQDAQQVNPDDVTWFIQSNVPFNLPPGYYMVGGFASAWGAYNVPIYNMSVSMYSSGISLPQVLYTGLNLDFTMQPTTTPVPIILPVFWAGSTSAMNGALYMNVGAMNDGIEDPTKYVGWQAQIWAYRYK